MQNSRCALTRRAAVIQMKRGRPGFPFPVIGDPVQYRHCSSPVLHWLHMIQPTCSSVLDCILPACPVASLTGSFLTLSFRVTFDDFVLEKCIFNRFRFTSVTYRRTDNIAVALPVNIGIARGAAGGGVAPSGLEYEATLLSLSA